MSSRGLSARVLAERLPSVAAATQSVTMTVSLKGGPASLDARKQQRMRSLLTVAWGGPAGTRPHGQRRGCGARGIGTGGGGNRGGAPALDQLTARDATLDAIGSQERQRRAEIAALTAERARLGATLPLILEQVQAKRNLSQRGYSPRFDLLELEKELAEVEYGAVAAKNREAEAEAALKGMADERRRER